MRAFIKLMPIALAITYHVSQVMPKLADIKEVYMTTPQRYSTARRVVLAVGCIVVDTLMEQPEPVYVKLNPIKVAYERYIETRQWDRLGVTSFKHALWTAWRAHKNNKYYGGTQCLSSQGRKTSLPV